jgi:hypothetical protein
LAATQTPVKSRPLKVVDSADQGSYDWELSRCGFFMPSVVAFQESANEGWETRFMVLTIEPGFMTYLERDFHREI